VEAVLLAFLPSRKKVEFNLVVDWANCHDGGSFAL